jgi:hypothetical protein
MVFDGLNPDRDLTIEDFRALLTQGKGCSILFTSTDRGLESTLDDLIVSIVEVVPLSTAGGVSLLAWAMDKPDPSHLLQVSGATIVESLKCKPLAICTFGRRDQDSIREQRQTTYSQETVTVVAVASMERPLRFYKLVNHRKSYT